MTEKDNYELGVRMEGRTVMGNIFRCGFTISADLFDASPYTPEDRNLLLNSITRLLEVIKYDAKANGDFVAVDRIDQGIARKIDTIEDPDGSIGIKFRQRPLNQIVDKPHHPETNVWTDMREKR